jgi:transposase-like protein
MRCGSAAVSERPERTAQGYRRFRCRTCGKQFNERSGGALNRTQYPSDVIALVVLWRLRYKLSLRDLSEMSSPAASYSALRRYGTGRPSSRRRGSRICVGAARWGAAGLSMKRT